MVVSTLFHTSRFFVKSKPVKNLLIQRSFTSSQFVLKELDPIQPKGQAPLEGIRVLDLTRVLGILKTYLYKGK